MHKKIFAAGIAVSLILTSGCSFAQTVGQTSQRLMVNGEEIQIPVYSIADSNYFRLRDLGYYMDFGVDYDESTNTVSISTESEYSGSAPEYVSADTADAVKSAQKILIDGAEADSVDVYNINGSNYFKLRDLAKGVDFGCRYNSHSNTVELSSDFGYNSANVFGRAKDESVLKMTAIDVGQGDSILIEFPHNAGEMLIDAGTADSEAHIIDYLSQELPDGKLEYLVATHPHADHIGSMKAVINNIAVDKFYNSRAAHTTKTYKNLIAAAEEKGFITSFQTGETVQVSDDVSFTFLGPVKDYEDLNNTSTVIRIDYGGSSFLFMGDAEQEAEDDIIASGADLSADVVKVGHHGSKTSSSQEFVAATGAKYAVVSLAYENDYNHPSAQTVHRWQQSGAKFLATSVLSDIVITSDGENIKAYPDEDYNGVAY